MKTKRSIRRILLLLMVFVTSAAEVFAVSASDLQAKISYESDISRLHVMLWSAAGHGLKPAGGTSFIITSGSTTIGTYSLSATSNGYEVKDIHLSPGNYTLTFPNSAICAYVKVGDDCAVEENQSYPERSFSFTCCDHQYSATGVCSKCKRYQRPDNSDGRYHITNYGNLKWYSEYNDAPAILDNDIIINKGVLNSAGNLNSIADLIEWTPFGTSYDFDGNHHSISGLYVTSEGYSGFISTAYNCTIQNLTIKDSYIHGTNCVGGIAGVSNHCTIIGCHNASTIVSETHVSYVSGISGEDLYGQSHFISCLNTGKLISPNGTCGISTNGTFTNCLCLEGTATEYVNNAHEITRKITAEDLRNGSAVLQLNVGYAGDALIWYQKLGTDAGPHTYSNGDDIVYGGFQHGKTVPTASNEMLPGSYHCFPFDSNGTTEDAGGHGYSIVDGECQVCHVKCTHDSYTDGVCTTCHFHCPHVFVNGFNDGNCEICGINMTGVYEPAPKAADGFYEVSNGGQLMWVSHHMGSFRLMNDIVVNEHLLGEDGTLRDASAVKHRLAENGMLVSIVIDGCGHTISGLYGKYFVCSWFRGGSIQNLGIVDSWFETTSICDEFESSLLKNFFSTATVKDFRVSREFQNSTIENCFFAGKNLSATPLFDLIVESSLSNLRTSGYKIYNTELKEYRDITFDDCIIENCQASVSRKEFKSGKVAYDLNNANKDREQVWYQRIGVDEYPVLTSNGKNAVYLVTDCQEKQGYANVSQDGLSEGNHDYDEITGFCHFCGNSLPGHQNPGDGYYEIANLADLYWFKAEAEKNPAINARLMNDIVMNVTVNVEDKSDLHEWSSINYFAGKFDGQHHTITGLYGESLFGSLNNATISNLGLVDYFMLSSEPVLAYTIHNTAITACHANSNVTPSTSNNSLIHDISKSTVDGCYVLTSQEFNRIVESSDRESSILNSYVINRENSQIDASGLATLTNCSTLSEKDFADGTATWLLNAGRYDGEQSYYQRLGVDKLPVLEKREDNAIYALPKSEGGLWYQNINPVDGHSVIYDGNEYICVFDNEEVYSPLDTRDYLTLTAVGRDVTIGLKKTGSPDDFKLQYAAKHKTWNTVELNSTAPQFLTIAAGDTIYFRRSDNTATGALAKSSEDYWSFTMEGDGLIEANGNIYALLDKKARPNTPLGNHAFEGLFRGCEKLAVAPPLYRTQLSPFCYAQMFAGTGIHEAPELPATELPVAAYMGMFQDCKLLTVAPGLPATKLGCRAYENLLKGCVNIYYVELPDFQIVDYDNTPEKAPMRNWLSGTASVGMVFTSPQTSQIASLAQNLPTGWSFPTYFIKEVKVSTDRNTETALNRLRNEGYVAVEEDLNYDFKSGDRAYDVYLGYKYTLKPSEAITQLMVIDQIQDHIVHSRQWLTTPYKTYQGKDFYLCPFYGDDEEGACLNRGRIGDVRHLSLYYSKTGNDDPNASFYTSLERGLYRESGNYLYVPWLSYGSWYPRCDTNADFEDWDRVWHYTIRVTRGTHKHIYGASFKWSDDKKSCQADIACISCGKKIEDVACTVSSAHLVEPSCTEFGIIRYTATAAVEEQTFTDYAEGFDTELKVQSYSLLSFTAVGADMTIGMAKVGSPNDYVLQYSPNMSAWTTVNLAATNNDIVVIPEGKTYYFRHGTETAINNISNNQNNYWSFTMTGDGSIEANGSVMSLLDANCQKNSMSAFPQHAFNSLFKGCEKLTVAPELSATSDMNPES